MPEVVLDCSARCCSARARRSSFPFGVRGSSSTSTIEDGTSQSGIRRSRLRRIRLYEFEAYYSRITNLNGTNETSRYFVSPVSTTSTSGEHLEINLVHDREFLLKPFAIVNGVSAPPGAYTLTRGRILFQTSRHRPLQVGTTTWMGSFFGGRLTQWDNYARLNTFQGRVQLGVNTTNNFGRVPAGRFVQRLWQAQAGFAFTPEVILSTFIQYDNQSHNVGASASRPDMSALGASTFRSDTAI